MTPATTKVAGGQQVYTREQVDTALRHYFEVFGELTAACFSPSSAKWQDRPELVDRYYAGDPLDGGRAWPSLNTIKSFHEGSFNAARKAVGLEANTPGPAAGRRKAGVHAPVRDVRERVRTRIIERTAPRMLVQRTEPVSRTVGRPPVSDARLRRQATKAEQRLAKTVESLRATRERLREANARAQRAHAAVREVTELRRRVTVAERALAVSESAASVLREALDTSQREHTRDTEKLAAVAMVSNTELQVARERVEDLEGLLELANNDELVEARNEVCDARRRVADSSRRVQEAHARVTVAVRERRAAEMRAERAERDASREAGRRKKMQLAIAGHDRPLSATELAELRAAGPAGPAVFLAAVKQVARAQSKGERAMLRGALRDAASAAVSWANRL